MRGKKVTDKWCSILVPVEVRDALADLAHRRELAMWQQILLMTRDASQKTVEKRR